MLRLALSPVPTFGQRVAWVLLGLLALFGILYVTVGATQRERFGCWYYGGDFIAFYSSARLILAGEGPAIYHRQALEAFQQSLLREAGSACDYGYMPMKYLGAALTPFLPVALLPLHWAFAAWSVLTLALASFALWRLAHVSQIRAWPLWLWALGSPYVYLGLMVGQVHGLLLVIVTEFAIALREDRQRRAGFWVSLLLVKPQFAPLVILFLVWKRQWQAVIAASAGGLMFLLASVLIVGPEGLKAYSGALLTLRDDGLTTGAAAIAMTNWRALGVDLARIFGLNGSLAIMLLLSAATLAAVFLRWRRRAWESLGEVERDSLMLGVTIAALLVGFHTHVHSDVLMIAPALLLLGAAVHRKEDAPSVVQSLVLEALLSAPAFLLLFLAFATGELDRAILQTDYFVLLLMALVVFVFPQLRQLSIDARQSAAA